MWCLFSTRESEGRHKRSGRGRRHYCTAPGWRGLSCEAFDSDSNVGVPCCENSGIIRCVSDLVRFLSRKRGISGALLMRCDVPNPFGFGKRAYLIAAHFSWVVAWSLSSVGARHALLETQGWTLG